MKKIITLLLFLLFTVGWQLNAQVTSFPWSEDFEGATFLPTGWISELPGGNSPNDITQNSDQNHTPGGQYSARFSSFSTSSDYNQYLFSEQIHVTAPYTQLTFWHRKYSTANETLEWGISTTGQSSADISTWTAVNLTNSDWQKETIDLSAYDGQDIYIGWHYYGDYLYYVYLDDVTIDQPPSCPDPSDLMTDNVTSDSAELSWTENGSATTWNIEYGPVGFTLGSGTVVASTTNPYTLTGLTSHTEYDFYVQSDCGSGDTSAWIGPFTFYTICDVVSTFPYNYGFENTTSNPGGDWSESCWSGNPENTGAGAYSAPYRWTPNEGGTPSGSTGPSGANTGNLYAYTEASGSNNGDIAELISPVFDLSGLTQPQLSFYYHMYGADIGTLSVDTYDGSAWTNDIWTLSGQQQTSNSDLWLQTIISLPNTVTQIRFRAVRGGGYNADIAIDDIVLQETPSCLSPGMLTYSNVTSNSVDFSWTENGTATAWNIEYGPAGFTQGAGTVVAVATNPYNLTGLTSNTTYDFYVQSDCGGGDVSSWEGPVSFTTLPGCGDTFYDDGGLNGDYSNNFFQTLTIYPDNAGDLVTVTFNSFDMEEGWDKMWVYDGPDTSSPVISSGNTDDSWTGGPGATYSADGQSFTSTHSTGALTFVFVTDSSVTHDGWEAVITCSPPPTCPEPSDLTGANITSDSVDLSWTENGTATAWNIEYGPAGFTQGTGTVVAVTTNPYTLTGLTPVTSYDVYVQSDCGSGDTSTWIGPYSFITSGTCGTFTVELIDSYGDGWNGGTLTVYVNGTAFLTGITLDNGTGPESHNIPVNQGDILSFEYTAGSYASENEYIVYDNNGVMVADEGANGTPGSIGDPSVPTGLQACPTCPAPSNLFATNITAFTADLSWTENGTATAWNIEYGPVGFTPGSGTVVAVTTNPYTLTGLTASTDYDYYVQSDCGSGDISTWEGPYSFTTLCDTQLPYIQNFDTGYDCWTVEDTNGDGRTWIHGSAAVPISCVSGSGDYVMFARFNTSQNMNDWLFSPGIYLTAGVDYTILFSYGNDGTDNLVEDMDVYISTAANSYSAINGTQIFSETGIADGCHNFSNSSITVPTDGTYYIAFHGKSQADQDILMIDDFVIDTTSSVDELTNVTGIYPNPTTGEFVIKSHDLNDGKVFIYSMTGKEIYHSAIDSDNYTINLNNVKKGVYFVKVTSDNKSYVTKLIIK